MASARTVFRNSTRKFTTSSRDLTGTEKSSGQVSGVGCQISAKPFVIVVGIVFRWVLLCSTQPNLLLAVWRENRLVITALHK